MAHIWQDHSIVIKVTRKKGYVSELWHANKDGKKTTGSIYGWNFYTFSSPSPSLPYGIQHIQHEQCKNQEKSHWIVKSSKKLFFLKKKTQIDFAFKRA